MVNLTPHAIKFMYPLYNEDGTIAEYELDIEVPASGQIARVAAKTIPVMTDEIDIDSNVVQEPYTINGIPVTTTEFGEVENLPDPEPGTIYIVSSLVAQRVPERTDVFIPNESVRDSEGRIVGCLSLGRIPANKVSDEVAARQLGFPSADAAFVAMMHS